MKTLTAIALLAGFACVPAHAQKLNLNFDAIAQRASKKTEVQFDHPPPFTSVDSVSIHEYEFAKPCEYADSELDPLRKQVNNLAGWSRFLNVKENGQHTEMYLLTQGGKPTGFLLIGVEPTKLSIIHISGSIQLAQLEELVNSTVHFKEPAQD
jgi:hypothetical protein